MSTWAKATSTWGESKKISALKLIRLIVSHDRTGGDRLTGKGMWPGLMKYLKIDEIKKSFRPI